MVCCTIIAAMLAFLLKPLRAPRADPLAWRPTGNADGPTRGPRKAIGRLQSFSYAFAGWRFLARNEPNMRIHLVVAVIVAIAGAVLEISAADWRWLVVAIAAVLVAEAMNTAVEQACNAFSSAFTPAIKAAKDVAAGGVLIAALAAVLIGASVFLPYLGPADAGGNQALIHAICGSP